MNVKSKMSFISQFYETSKTSPPKERFFYRVSLPIYIVHTLRSQIEGYTSLLIFRKCSTLPAVIRASPLIKFEEKFQPPLLLEPPLVLET